MERQITKSLGQIAYEADVARRPLYHDRTLRRAWEQLSDIARWSWERPGLLGDRSHGSRADGCSIISK